MRQVADILAGFEVLPKAGVHDVLQGQKALILAPHPDDESLGCGGLIAAACAAGLPPIVAIMTDGAASHPGSGAFPPARLAALRELEVREAVATLGLPPEHLFLLHYADTHLPESGAEFDAACIQVALIAAETGCKSLLAPWRGDPHCDHQAAAMIADAVAARGGLRLLSYPVWGWLRNEAEMVDEPRCGGWRLDITAHLAAKQAAISCHKSQYGGLITDSPDGFQLPDSLLAVFARPFEVFIA